MRNLCDSYMWLTSWGMTSSTTPLSEKSIYQVPTSRGSSITTIGNVTDDTDYQFIQLKYSTMQAPDEQGQETIFEDAGGSRGNC